MRTILLLALALVPSIAPLVAQSAKVKVPKKGDTVVIRGCLRGSSVESAQTMAIGAEGETKSDENTPTFTYRLQGDKALLKELKDSHDRRVVEVKGILRSELSGSGIGRDVGRTRITIGVDPRTARSAPMPVLEAIAFEGTTVDCER
jgi:hypothetical protein